MRSDSWSRAEEEAAIAAFHEGMTYADMPEIVRARSGAGLLRSADAIRLRLKWLGVTRKREWTTTEDAILLKGKRLGWRPERILAELQIASGREITRNGMLARLARLTGSRSLAGRAPRKAADAAETLAEEMAAGERVAEISAGIVSGDELVAWLRASGHEARRNPNAGDPLGSWILDGRKMTWGQVVLNGNRLRIAAGHPAIHVPGIAA